MGNKNSNKKALLQMYSALFMTVLITVACGSNNDDQAVVVAPPPPAPGVVNPAGPNCTGCFVGADLLLQAKSHTPDNLIQMDISFLGDPTKYVSNFVPWTHPKAPIYYNGPIAASGQLTMGNLPVYGCGAPYTVPSGTYNIQTLQGGSYALQTISPGAYGSVMFSGLKLQAIPQTGNNVTINFHLEKGIFYNPNTVARDQVNSLFVYMVIESINSTPCNNTYFTLAN